MKSKAESQILVSDLGLAALLVTLQFELVGLERTNEKRVDFVFASTKELEKAVGDFWQDGNVNVPIQTLFNNFRLLKNRLYAFK
jgi:hypothetical protein